MGRLVRTWLYSLMGGLALILLLLLRAPLSRADEGAFVASSTYGIAEGNKEIHLYRDTPLPPRPLTEAEIRDFAAQVITLANQERAVYGLPPLVANAALTTAAVRHSQDMATNDFFSHTGSDGSNPGQRITQAGYVWYTYGENIAAGYSSPSSVVAGWMGSAGHRANILNHCFQDIGVGYVYDTGDTYPGGTWGYIHYWTMDLAARTYACLTLTPTPTMTGAAIATPTPTRTASRTFTATATRTPTATSTGTATSTVAVFTPTRTATATATRAPTQVVVPPTPTRTATSTAVPPTATRTATTTATRTPTQISVVHTPTRTATLTAVPPTTTRTATATATRTPTWVVVPPSPTRTHTVTYTPLPAKATILGQIQAQGRPAPPNAQWVMSLRLTLGSAAYNVETDFSGHFMLSELTPGAYEVRVKGRHTLTNTISDARLVAGENTLDLGLLREGDVNDDDVVDISDFSVLRSVFGTVDPRADFNQDGVVDIVDFSLLRPNFGMRGPILVTQFEGE